MSDLVAIFAVDPGTTTGIDYGLWSLNLAPKEAVTEWSGFSDELSGDLISQAAKITKMFCEFSERVESLVSCGFPYLVMESYQQRPTPHMGTKESLDPVRLAYLIVGRLSVLSESVPSICWQTATLAKTYATDERLRNWGSWLVGKPHARDARRHSLAFWSGLPRGRS